MIGTIMFLSKGEQLMILLGVLAPGVWSALLFSRVLPPPVRLSRRAMLNLALFARQLGAGVRLAY